MTTYDTSETPILMLEAKTATDLTVPTIVSVPVTATLQEAVALLTEKNVSAVPVLDGNGHPVGVLSRSDIVAHDCQNYGYLRPGPKCEETNHFILGLTETRPPQVVGVEQPQAVLVQDVMTPVVYSVARNTSADTVVDGLLSLNVHRLFVTDEEGEIIGVISMTDVLRHLRRPYEERSEPSDQGEVICGELNGSLP